MYKILLPIILLLVPLVNADPFYSEQQRENKVTKNHFEQPACEPKEDTQSIYIPIDFYDLNFVGVMKINKNIKAIFINKQNKLFIFSKNDLIVPSYIQINNIDLKHIIITDWKNTEICQIPKTIQMKL